MEQARKEYTYIDKQLFNRNKKYKSLEELEKILDSGRFNIDIDGVHFECLFNNKKSEYLYVVFNGGRTEKTATPQFPRWSYSSLFKGNYLGIEDPMYYKYDNLKIGWYYGTKNKSYIEYCVLIIKSICKVLNIPSRNVIFFSSSGGGYAGIYASTLLKDSLSISINPQLYIQNYILSEHFTQETGLSLKEYDILNRNNLFAQIASNKTSKHVILFNLLDLHHIEKHLYPFVDTIGIDIRYGLTEYENILLWTYSCIGAPSAHTSFETRVIFSVIDYISKKFKEKSIDEELQNIAIFTNEMWNDIYKREKIIQQSNNNAHCLILSEKHVIEDQSNIKEYYINLNIKNNENNFYYFKINIKKYTRNTILIQKENIIAPFKEFNIAIFDFLNKKNIFVYKFSTFENIAINFIIGNSENIAICIYAGLQGATKNNTLEIKNVKHIFQNIS